MTRLEAFRELYARLATAVGGSEELDVAVTAFFRHAKVEPLTRSVDAGLAAVEALPAVWRVTGFHWIARGDGEHGWGAFLSRRNDRISPICAAFVGASDGWTPRTAALALACVVCAARYAEETGQGVFVDRPRGARDAA